MRTCFLAALTASEHELREGFTYIGRAVFGPHIDVETLWLAAESEDRRGDLPIEIPHEGIVR